MPKKRCFTKKDYIQWILEKKEPIQHFKSHAVGCPECQVAIEGLLLAPETKVLRENLDQYLALEKKVNECQRKLDAIKKEVVPIVKEQDKIAHRALGEVLSLLKPLPSNYGSHLNWIKCNIAAHITRHTRRI